MCTQYAVYLAGERGISLWRLIILQWSPLGVIRSLTCIPLCYDDMFSMYMYMYIKINHLANY
ncbi:hypothetical protein Peur_012350 [Populus x canadensis]